jgi:uncharacterized protein
MGRPVVHWEFWSENPERTAGFYSRVFDWDIRLIPEMSYRLVDTGGQGGINGGIMKPQAGPWPAQLALYVDVDDIDAYRARIVEAGGRMLVEKTDVPEVGQFALFQDPDGRVLGMWKKV